MYLPDDKDGGVFHELVRLPTSLKVNLTPDGVAEVDLSVQHVGERRGVRVWIAK